MLLSTVIGYLFGIINPVFTRFFMDHLLTGENRELLMPFLLLMAVMGLALKLSEKELQDFAEWRSAQGAGTVQA